MTLSDAEALRRTAAGDAQAFELVLDRHEAAVLRFIRGLMDDDRAEDALQETFIAAWRGAAGFRGEGSVRSWLLGIARNAVHRQRRRRAGEPARHEPLQELAVSAGWGGAAPDPGRRIEARELVEKGFAGLAPEDREILILRDLEGFTGEEAAKLLGLSLAAQKSRLHRARLRFVAALKEVDHGA